MTELDTAVKTLGEMLIGDLPYEYRQDGEGSISCPTCTQTLVQFDFEWTDNAVRDLALARLSKLYTWTVAQLVAFRTLQARSGVPFGELLDLATGGPTLGDHVGVYFHGMYIGIEKDGYTHS